MVRGQHSDSKARAQRCIQKAAEDHLVLQQQERINAFCFTDKTKQKLPKSSNGGTKYKRLMKPIK